MAARLRVTDQALLLLSGVMIGWCGARARLCRRDGEVLLALGAHALRGRAVVDAPPYLAPLLHRQPRRVRVLLAQQHLRAPLTCVVATQPHNTLPYHSARTHARRLRTAGEMAGSA